jgi:putative ABC transport system permease protein
MMFSGPVFRVLSKIVKMNKRKKTSSPDFAQKLLGIILPEVERDSLLGDYEELFKDLVSEKNRVFALVWYWFQILNNIPQFIIGSILWSFIMLKNYLKVTLRNLIKHKGFSIINVFSLAFSMSICLMTVVFIKDQKSSDQFHKNKDRIVRVITTNEELGWDVDGWATTPGFLAPYLQKNYDFVDDVVRMREMWGTVLTTGTEIIISGLYAEPSFFDIFSFNLKRGFQETALENPYSIILSEETAFKFFGNSDPINKTLTIDKFGDFTITGVIKDIDQKSHFRFDALISFSTLPSLLSNNVLEQNQGMNDWSSFKQYYTYVLLKNENEFSKLENYLSKIANLLIPMPENKSYGFDLQSLQSINLGLNLHKPMMGTKPRFDIYYIPFLAILVMFLTCFNYINLSIARSLKRSKEIGVRKVFGSRRNQVIGLFLSETFVLTFLALIVACLLLLWLIPVYNGFNITIFLENQINIEQLKDPVLYIIFSLFTIGIALIAGLYPAFYLSSFQPVNALHGRSKIKGFTRLLTKKILIGIQFSVSLIFIIFIIYLFQFHTYFKLINHGISTENKVSVSVGNANHDLFKNEIMRNSDAVGVCVSSDIPIYGGIGEILKFTINNDEEFTQMNYYSVDPAFIHNFDIQLIAGRNFSDEYSTDSKNAIIINEQAVKSLKLNTPGESIGTMLKSENNSEICIIGVIEDFTTGHSFNEPNKPFALLYRQDEFKYVNVNYIKGKEEKIEANILGIWQKLNEVYPVQYTFFRDKQEDLERQFVELKKMISGISGFVILVTLLGLLGMATYTIEIKVKEIGIRKVLGASVFSMTYLLLKDNLILILFSAVFAIPIGFLLSEQFFLAFAQWQNLNLWVLPVALLFILSLTFITIGFQTIKAALTNPSDTLRVE